MAKNGKPLRFAALIRVSTEKQEKRGESLRTQAKQIDAAVASIGGKIVATYSGQEHATKNWERKLLDQLLADATKKPRPFDAVIVADATRWSRDNVRSENGLEQLRDCGVRFFVLGNEYDLFNAEARLFLALTATIGAYHARTQKKKSIENRIERAKRGMYTAGKLPFGRTFDKKTEKWGIDPEKKALVEDVAKRYLAGESMPDLAEEYGVNPANLHKNLMKRCGVDWEQSFQCDEPLINVTIPTKIPRLLTEKTIKACRERAAANRTYKRKRRKVNGYYKNDYLLSGLIRCEHCDYVLTGELNHGTTRNYRHARISRVRACPCNRRTVVNADSIEAKVIERLFETFGNPQAVQRAIEEAIPNQAKVAILRKQKKRLKEALAKIKDSKRRLLQKEIEGFYDEDEIKEQRTRIQQHETKHQTQLQQINDQLEHLPSGDLVVTQEMVERFQQSMFPATVYERQRKMPQLVPNKNGRLSAKLWAKTGVSDDDIGRMSWDDKRALIELMFGGKTLTGKPAGVYIRWQTGKDGKTVWRYSIQGIIPLDDSYETNDVTICASR